MTDDEKAALADVYERAAEELERVGWQRGGGMVTTGATCVGVAMYRVHHNQVNLGDVFRFFAKALELDGDGDCFAVYAWNDDPTRTKDEVINTLHALANKLR